MTPTTATTFTERLEAVINLFGNHGTITLKGRSLLGFGERDLLLNLPLRGLPMPLLQLLLEDWEVRIRPHLAGTDGTFLSLPLLVAFWKLPTALIDRQHVVTGEGRATVDAALATMPPATIRVDAGHEAWVAWQLTQPLSDEHSARTALKAIAAQLGADAAPPEALPIGGSIRNWNINIPTPIAIDEVNPSRAYGLEELLKRESN